METLKTTGLMAKQIVVYGYGMIAFSHKGNEILIHATIRMNLENLPKKKESRYKRPHIHDCIYVKYLEGLNP